MAVEGSRLFGSSEERRAGLRTIGVRNVALAVKARTTIRARTAPNRRRDDDPIARSEVPHALADFFDDAHAFVAEDGTGNHARHRASDHM